MSNHEELLALVYELDWEAIEGARDEVSPEHIPDLVAAYHELDDWMQKIALANLVQDQAHEALRPMMLDILRAPLDQQRDEVEVTKAMALGHLDEKHDRFMYYYEHRDDLHRAVAEVLAAHGLTAVESAAEDDDQEPARAPVAPPDPAAALVFWCEHGDLDRVRALLDAGVPVDAGLTTDTPLLAACLGAHDDVGLLLVERGANVRATRVGGQTPLWWAAGNGQARLVETLLARGTDVDAADQWGGTPLLQAAKGHGEVVRILVAHGADVRAAYHDGRTPAWFAAYTGAEDALLALLDAGVPIDEPITGTTLLGLACREGHAQLVDVLLARGANVEAADEDGPPLAIAAGAGYPAIVRALLAAGADRHRVHAGKRAIDHAVGRRAAEIRALLA